MSGFKVDAKVVLLGKEYGGKTSLVERFLHNRFAGEMPYQNTIGAAYGAKRVEAFGRQVVLGIWDTAGSERYQAMSRIYYRGTWAAVLCYDLTDPDSLAKVHFWATELRQHEPHAHMYFVGTKKDLLDDDPEARRVDYYSVVEFANQTGGGPVFETSARSGENVDELFSRIAKDYVKESREGGNASSSSIGSGGVALDPSTTSKSSCRC
uniref:Ras-related protein Rab-24 n=1 Tax=Plectus sambesii TaxID=2011161 RepID=A0A914X0E6_9BILA